MSEIQWLVDLMLNNKLPDAVRQKFIARIGEVEAQLARPMLRAELQRTPLNNLQAPSTQRILDEVPVQIAQTPAAAQALASREQAIANAMSGKTEVGRTSPRKF